MNVAAQKRSADAFVNLDFMRSIAVLLVSGAHLLYYTDHLAWLGWMGITGVSIFFVHTSLVLMWSLERDPDVGRFYLRRAFRIYPLWLVVLALTVLTRLPMSPAYAPAFRYFHASRWEVLNNVFLTFGPNYPARIVGASWSLPIEVEMYLFLPCLFFFARSLRKVWPLLVLDLFVMYYNRLTHPPLDSSLPMCVPYFLPGIMAFVLKKQHRLARLPGYCFPIWLLGLIAIDRHYGSFRHSWLFCLVLGLSLPLFHDMSWRPVKVLSAYVARYSYGIYLSHITAICVSVYLLRTHALPVRVLAFAVVFVVLPVLFFHEVEKPIIEVGARLARRLGSPGPRSAKLQLEEEMVP